MFLDLNNNPYLYGYLPITLKNLVGKKVNLSKIPFKCPLPDWAIEYF